MSLEMEPLVPLALGCCSGPSKADRGLGKSVSVQDLMQAVLKDSAEIDNATANLATVYELTGAATRTETHKRCRAYLDAVGRELEILMRKTWPSHHEALRREGLL